MPTHPVYSVTSALEARYPPALANASLQATRLGKAITGENVLFSEPHHHVVVQQDMFGRHHQTARGYGSVQPELLRDVRGVGAPLAEALG